MSPRQRPGEVWLGLNHNYAPFGAPLIFETMVFAEGSRCATEAEAR